MSKEIKDYIHLYLGCELIGIHPSDDQPRKGYLTGIHGEYEVEIQFFEEDEVNVSEQPEYNKFTEVKPILRPLSDMTEEAFKKLVGDCLDYYPDQIIKQKDAIWGRKTLTKERCRLSFDVTDYYTIHFWTDFTSEDKKVMPPIIKINHFVNECRKLSFDMDGLIESGLAISKTKTQEQ